MMTSSSARGALNQGRLEHGHDRTIESSDSTSEQGTIAMRDLAVRVRSPVAGVLAGEAAGLSLVASGFW
jgi:hypothetical protein